MTSNKPIFKESFLKYFKNLLGDELDDFIIVCKKPLIESIRVNTIKINKKKLKSMLEKKGWVLENIKFYKDAFIVKKRDMSLGNTIEHFNGFYYVQEQSSMIPPLVLDPKEDELILDCCASPGSKTSQLAMMINNQGNIIANDKGFSRISILQTNLQRLGIKNIITTNGLGQRFKVFENKFDKILLDAPCTGFGAIRKDWSIAKQFNPKSFKFLVNIQKSLLEACWKALKPKGTLVYSTCTLTTEENEEQIKNFLKEHDDAIIKNINLKGFEKSRGIDLKESIRIWPHKIDMEGFFIAKLVKK